VTEHNVNDEAIAARQYNCRAASQQLTQRQRWITHWVYAVPHIPAALHPSEPGAAHIMTVFLPPLLVPLQPQLNNVHTAKPHVHACPWTNTVSLWKIKVLDIHITLHTCIPSLYTEDSKSSEISFKLKLWTRWKVQTADSLSTCVPTNDGQRNIHYFFRKWRQW